MSATAMERYAHFMETYPDIMQKVPQKKLPLIWAEALSKIRKELSPHL
jgi:hypothetical protein